MQTAQLKELMQQDPAEEHAGEHAQQPTVASMMKQTGDTAAAYAAAAVAPPCAVESESGDMLVDHLTLANTKLRQVIQAAGLDPISSLQPLRDLQHSIQQQQPRSSRQQALHDDELLAASAEENYQLRHMVRQLQLQQQFLRAQQQHEATVAASHGDPLELDRFSVGCVSPAVVAADDVTGTHGSSSSPGVSPAARAGAVAWNVAPETAGLASKAGSAAVPLRGTTARSPAVMAAGTLVPPSASAVQLAEGEAAAQLMTQAVIQAEAAAVYDSVIWQNDNAVEEAYSVQQQQQESQLLMGVQQQPQDQQLHGVDADGSQLFGRMPVTANAELASGSSLEPSTVVDSAAAMAVNSSSFGLLKLPKLLLPARVLRRSFSRTRSTDAASESPRVSNSTPRSNVMRSANNTTCVAGDRSGSTAAGSQLSTAGSGTLGLKQLASDLHLLTSHHQPGGIAAESVFGAGAVDMGGAASCIVSSAVHADAAATVATAAAAQLWYPAAVAALRDDASVAAVSHTHTAARVATRSVHGSKFRNEVAGSTSPQRQSQQEEEQQNLGPIAQLQGQLKALRVHSTSAVPPAQPAHVGVARFGMHMAGNHSAAAQAAAAAAAFAGHHPALLQHGQQKAPDDLPALPKLRLHGRAAPAAAQPSSSAIVDGTTNTAAADCCSSSSSPYSDSGFFRDASAAAVFDDSAASVNLDMLPAAAGSTAAHLPPPVPHATAAAAGVTSTGFGMYRRYRGSGVFSSNGRISSDLFGARISMDGSVGLPPGVPLTGTHTNYSSRDQLSDLAGWYGVSDTLGDAADGTITRTDTLTSNLNSSEFLGVSYQQSWQQQSGDVLQGSAAYDSLGTGASAAAATAGAADVLHCSDQQWPSLPKLHLPGRRLQQSVQRRSSTSSSTKDQQYLPQRQPQLSDTGTVESIGSLVAAPDIPDNYFFQDYISSTTSGSINSIRGQQSAPMQSLQSAAAAAADPRSISRPESEVTLAGIDVLSQQMSEVKPAAANCSKTAQQQQQHLAMPDLSILTLNVQARTQQPTPVIGQTPAVSALHGSLADNDLTLQQYEEQQEDQRLFGSSTQLRRLHHQQLDPVPVAPGVAPALTAASAAITSGELGGGISSDKLRQLLTDLAVAQEEQQQLLSAVTPRADDATSAGTPSTARSGGVLTMQASGPLSPLSVPPQAAVIAVAAPARPGLQRQPSAGIPPKSPSREIPRPRQQQQHDGDLAASVAAEASVSKSLQRALCTGSTGVQSLPKWGPGSGSSSSLTAFAAHQQQLQLSSSIRSPRDQDAAQDQQQQQHDHTQWQQQQSFDSNTHGPAAAAVRCQERCRSITPTAAAACGTAFRLSPGGGIHSRLRVVTAVRPPLSNGSNSDVETNSTTTTPLHHPGAHTRNNSGSSIPFRAGSGLASITVPPSPASSGVRYVPASPRIVGFDCPSTPLSTLRSPSCRSDYSNTELAVAASAAAAGMAVGHYGVGPLGLVGVGGVGALCGSGCSTPRRQPTSPGLLHQALARQGHINGCSSGSSTPLSRRAASTSAVPYPGLGVANGHNSMHLPQALLGNLPSAFAAHAVNCGLFPDSNSNSQQQQRQSSHSIEISPRGTGAGPSGVRSPPGAGGAATGVHGRARSCSSTLLNILTAGTMQQQIGLQLLNTHTPYIQQPQPLPLQQQQQGHGGHQPSVLKVQCESHVESKSNTAAAAEIGDTAAYGSAVEDAVDGELSAAAAAATAAAGHAGDDQHQHHYMHRSSKHQDYHNHHQQQQMGLSCGSSSPRVTSASAAAAAAHLPTASGPAAAAAAMRDRVHRPESPVSARSRSPLSRSISPTPLGGGSSGSSGQPLVAGAASPSRSTQDGHHPVKLSRFGQMAAAAAEAHQIMNHGPAATTAAAEPAPAEPGSADGCEIHPARGAWQGGGQEAALDDTPKARAAAAAAVVAADLCAHLSAASSLASPETPAIVEAAHAAAAAGSGCDSGTDITPTAAASAMAQNGFRSAVLVADRQMPPAAASIQCSSSLVSSAAAAQISEAETAATPAGPQGAELQTPQQQQQQEQLAAAQIGHVMAATSAAAATLGSSSDQRSNHGQQQNEVVIAGGRRAAQHDLSYVPAHMGSNPDNALQQILVKRTYSGPSSSINTGRAPTDPEGSAIGAAPACTTAGDVNAADAGSSKRIKVHAGSQGSVCTLPNQSTVSGLSRRRQHSKRRCIAAAPAAAASSNSSTSNPFNVVSPPNAAGALPVSDDGLVIFGAKSI